MSGCCANALAPLDRVLCTPSLDTIDQQDFAFYLNEVARLSRPRLRQRKLGIRSGHRSRKEIRTWARKLTPKVQDECAGEDRLRVLENRKTNSGELQHTVSGSRYHKSRLRRHVVV
jgi:hypothetical protein